MNEPLKALLEKWTKEAAEGRRLGPSTVSDTLDKCCRELRETTEDSTEVLNTDCPGCTQGSSTPVP